STYSAADLLRSSQFGPRKSREYDSPLGRNLPTRSSNPFISSSAVSKVHAFAVLPPLASGVSRRTPLPRPSVVSNLKIASIALVPARVTKRGGVRSGSVLKPIGLARPTCAFRTLRMESKPLTVLMRQVKASRSRQWLSGGNNVLSRTSSGSATALSNCASQWSAMVAMVSVLASIRALKLSICAASLDFYNLHHLSRADRGVMDATPGVSLDDALHRVLPCPR